MGRGTPQESKKLRRRRLGEEKRTEQGALFAASPAIVYHGTGRETEKDKAFIFNDLGAERFIKNL